MTTANLMNVPSVNARYAAQTESSKKLQDEELKVAEMFAGLVNQTAIVSNQVVDETSSNRDVKVNSTQSAAESYERYSYKDKQIEAAEEPSMNEQLEEVAEDLEKAESDVLNAIADEYGVSEEEIQNLLDEMGLSVLDLLNPENLVNFIMQLTGVASSEELLLDESFLKIMETMDALAEGLMKDLNVDMEGLQELIDEMELVTEETQIPEEFQNVIDTVVENTDTEETTEEIAEETTEEGSIQVENEEVNSEVKTTDATSNEQEAFSNNQNSENNSLLNHNSNSENLVTNQPNVTVNTFTDMVQSQFTSYLGTDTMQIMEQIVQQMKVSCKLWKRWIL